MSPPPRSLESHAQQVRRILSAPVSDRWVLVEWTAFLERLAPARPETEAYLLPLAAPLADRLADLDPVGLSPDRLAQGLARLRAARQHHAPLHTADALQRIETTLRRRVALLYGYAGAPERAVSCLTGRAAPFDVGADVRSPRERVRRARRRAAPTDVQQVLQWVLDHWDRTGPDRQETHVPVVERLPSWARPAPWADDRVRTTEVGGLRRVALTLTGPAEDADRLQTGPAGDETDSSSPWAPALAAARTLLDRQFGGAPPPVNGRLHLGPRPQDHEGRSADLAVAALFCGAVLDYTRRRRRLRLRPPVAMTGAVARDGTTEPVSSDTLALKVQTAFFSPATRLVVPAAQRPAAVTVRDALLDDFPHGRLDVTGVDRLETLFYDRRLTHQRRIGRLRHAAQWLWDRRGPVAGGTVVAALLLIIGVLLYGPLDRNPVQAQRSGATMQVQNEAGQPLETLHVGAYVAGLVKRGRTRQAITFADVAGGPANEVIWMAAIDSLDEATALRCKSVGADTLLWERPLQFEVSFPNQADLITPTFRIRDFFVADLAGDAAPELYAAATHVTYSPGLLLQLDARTGAEQQRYVHPGHLTDLEHRDLDADGVGEVLASGYSNAYNDPVLTVLDARRLQGHAPTTPEYTIAGLPPASHHAYLRFPDSPVQRAAPQRLQMTRKVRLEHSAGLVAVEVLDGNRTRAEGPSYLVLHFNYQLQPTAVGTSSGYTRLAEKLVRAGSLDAIPTSADFARYRQRIRYWTGTDWTSPADRSSSSPTHSALPEGDTP